MSDEEDDLFADSDDDDEPPPLSKHERILALAKKTKKGEPVRPKMLKDWEEELLADTKKSVSKGDIAALQDALSQMNDKNSHPKEQEEFKHRLLCRACDGGHAEAARILLRAGASIEWEYCHEFDERGPNDDCDPCYPVHAATDDVLRVIVEERGSDALDVFDNDPYRGKAGPQRATPLLRAALDGRGCTVLLELGADPNCADGAYELYSFEQEFCPLHAAVVNMGHELCQDLLECGAECNQFALRMAMDNSDEEMFNLLARLATKRATVQCSGPLCNKTVKGLLRELLEEAIEDGAVPKVKQIIRTNVIDLNERDRGSGTTPLWDAMHHNQTDIAKILLANGADQFLPAREWQTDFETAIADDKMEFVQMFLPLWTRAFPTGTNVDGDRPLHILCQVRQASLKALECVLDDQPGEVQEPDGTLGLLPVFLAAMWDLQLDVIFSLLRRYPDPISTDSNPIHAKALETDEEEPPQKKARTGKVLRPLPPPEEAIDEGDEDDGDEDDNDNKKKPAAPKKTVAGNFIRRLRPPPKEESDDDEPAMASASARSIVEKRSQVAAAAAKKTVTCQRLRTRPSSGVSGGHAKNGGTDWSDDSD